MKYLSLFSGIGGFELGIQQAYEQITNEENWECRECGCTQARACEGGCGWKEPKLCDRHELVEDATAPLSMGDIEKLESWRRVREYATHCVGFSEIDKYATQIYQSHFPTHKNYGDITKINAAELPDFELLVGGFPCQAFSIAGKRKGFEDTRGTLFFEIARILKAKQPRLFCLENVKGLLSHDNGATFSTIISTLDELGYDLQWQVLNSKNHGVPQNRERVFVVGHLRGTSRPEVFPFGESGSEDIGTNGKRTSKSAQTVTRQGGLNARGTFVETSYTIDANYHKGTNTLEKSRRQVIAVPEATRDGCAYAGVGDSINLAVPNSKTRRGRVGKGVAQTLDTGMQQHTLTEDMRIRRLTPTECERLQGFPDGWTDGVSDTQRYKCLGNAVTVNVIEDVVSKML